MEKVIDRRMVGEKVIELDITPTKVRYSNGYETVMKFCIAEKEEKLGRLKILGEGKAAPPPKKDK